MVFKIYFKRKGIEPTAWIPKIQYIGLKILEKFWILRVAPAVLLGNKYVRKLFQFMLFLFT